MRKTILTVLFNLFPIALFAFSVSADKGVGLFAYACNGGSANNGVYFKNSTENILSWSLNSFLSTVNNDSLSPSVAGINGFVYNAWLDNNLGIYRVFLRRGLTGDPLELSGGGNCSSVNIFSGSTGSVHAVWSEDGVIYYKKGFNNGSNWSDVKTISSGSSENPFVFESGNLLIVLWQGGGSSYAEYSTRGQSTSFLI